MHCLCTHVMCLSTTPTVYFKMLNYNRQNWRLLFGDKGTKQKKQTKMYLN